MEKANRERIKEILLVGFVLLSVGLIFALWVNAFAKKDAETPYFYRGIPGVAESFDATETALAEQSMMETATPIPSPTRLQPTATLMPSATPDLLLNFTPESDQ